MLSLIGLLVISLGVVVFFRRLPQLHLTTNGHAIVLIVAGLFVMVLGAGTPGASGQLAASDSAQTPPLTASAIPIPTLSPTATPSPTPVPTPTGDPHLLSAANVTQSIRDNRSFEGNTNFDGLNVDVRRGGQIVVVAKPGSFLDEQYFITLAAEDSLLVMQAVKGWYAGVTVIHVQLDADFTDKYGNSTSEPGAWLEFRSDTMAKINPSGLTTRTFAQPSDLFAVANAYYIHPAIFVKLSADQRGQLLHFTYGPRLINPIPA